MYILEKFEALGTYWWIESFASLDAIDAQFVQGILIKTIQTFESDYSRFKEDSIIGLLNKKKIYHSPPPELVEMLRFCQQLHAHTGGLFHPGVCGILEGLGYDKDYSFTVTKDPVALPRLSEILTVNPDQIVIHGDYAIDLGGMGKGYLIDRLAKVLREHLKIEYFVINGGGDIYASSDHGAGVELFVEDSDDLSRASGSVWLKNQALCVSSTYRRQWHDVHRNKKFHHLIHPDGNGVQDITVAVQGKSALIADALATVLCLMDDYERCLKVADDYGVKFRKISPLAPLC